MSTENLFPFNEPDVIALIKLEKRGRKSHTNIPVDDQYFNVYYHFTKTEIVCE